MPHTVLVIKHTLWWSVYGAGHGGCVRRFTDQAKLLAWLARNGYQRHAYSAPIAVMYERTENG